MKPAHAFKNGERGKPIFLGDIENAVAARFGLTREAMRSLTHARAVARPRQIAMFLAREITGHSLPRIGRHFGRDHTTVLHAVRRIGKLTTADPRFAAEVEGCRELLARAREGEAP
jgi:chromosomal replication initiator protein